MALPRRRPTYPDMREREGDDPARVGRIAEDLLVSGHRRVEAHFPWGLPEGAEGPPRNTVPSSKTSTAFRAASVQGAIDAACRSSLMIVGIVLPLLRPVRDAPIGLLFLNGRSLLRCRRRSYLLGHREQRLELSVCVPRRTAMSSDVRPRLDSSSLSSALSPRAYALLGRIVLSLNHPAHQARSAFQQRTCS
jgi:hypothetical protein